MRPCSTGNKGATDTQTRGKTRDGSCPRQGDGSWALIEVKLGGEDDIKEAGNNLLKIAKDIDEEKTGKPAFLMVVTKNRVAYRMENGVYVVPLCCLKN